MAINPRRALIGGFKEESNTFVPFKAGMREFREGLYWAEGEGMFRAFAGKRLEISGFLDALGAGDAGWELVPSVAAEAVPSGPVEQGVLDWFVKQWLAALDDAGPVDAILLALHGATTTDQSDDACGDLLAALRAHVGPAVFIGATFDLHANITRRMLAAANVLYGYHTYPHVDQYEVGYHVGRLARAWGEDGLRPAMAMCKVPMLVSPGAQSTSAGPFADLMVAARGVEAIPGILGASLFPVQPWMDIDELGFAALVVSAGDAGQAQREADALGRQAWRRRHDFDLQLPSADEAVRQALAVDGGPVVIADLGDGPGGGAGGDSTALLEAFLAQDAGRQWPVLVTMTDPPAVAAAMAAGVGAAVTLRLGGKVSHGFFGEVEVAGRVVYAGSPSYHAYKVETAMGPTVVVESRGIYVVISAIPVLTVTPHPYVAAGLDPRTAKIVVAKSSTQFREEFEPFARVIVVANTPGPTSSDFVSLPFERIPRPMYPWEDWDWHP